MENKTLIQLTTNSMILAAEMAKEALENNGEISERKELDLLSNELELSQKVDSYFVVMEQFKAQVAILKEREEMIYKARKSLESQIESMQERLKFSMDKLEVDKLEGVEHYFKLSKSKPYLEILDKVAIPNSFKKEIVVPEHIEYEIDKDKIKEALEMGFTVEGARFKFVRSLSKGIKK
jgi:hypothetical protein